MKFSLIFKFLIKNLMNFSQIIIICKIVMQWNVMEKIIMWKLLLINGFGYLKKPWIIDNLVYYSLNY